MDKRIEELARILVDYSAKVKKGEVVEIFCEEAGKPLFLEVYKQVLKKEPKEIIVDIRFPETREVYFRNATDSQLEQFPELAMHIAKNTNVAIQIGAPTNLKSMSNIEPKKFAIKSRTMQPLSDYVVKNVRWVLTEFPTEALAQEAEMSLEEFEDFVFSATNVDWKAMSNEQDKIKAVFDNAKKVRIVGHKTDLTLSLDGRYAVKGDGSHNMPDGEIFYAPVDDSANGIITYEYPCIYSGREVDGVCLEFKDGKVVKATAEKNEKFLLEMLDTDEGARFLGEFGIGTNFGITKYIKNILFDEKIGGTIHLALGMAYEECGGKNKSAIHWDMIKDLREGGEIYVDGKLVQKNGKWVF